MNITAISRSTSLELNSVVSKEERDDIAWIAQRTLVHGRGNMQSYAELRAGVPKLWHTYAGKGNKRVWTVE